jgi:type VI secretion system protein ImpJ
MIEARSDALARQRGEAPGDLVNYWLANAFNSALGPLTHHYRSRRAHPERLYAELLRLAGALCTFSLTAHPRDLPLYDHDHLDQCCIELDRQIQELMNVVVPTGGIRIALEPAGESFYHGKILDRRCLGPSRWYLGVRSSETPAEIAARVPRLVKVCSAKFIERLVREAFPGLAIEHVGSPPPQISPRLGMEYFVIPPSGPCWTSIVETAEVGVYAPGAIPNAELELVVAIEGKA